MRRFFIFSLPRSGTAWLSVFLTGRDSFCYHDPLSDCNIQELADKMIDRPESVVGAIDTGAYLDCVSHIRDEWESFVVLRDPREIQASSDRHKIIGYNAVAEAKRLAEATRGLFQIRHSLLDDLSYLEDIWERVTRLPFDRERAEALLEMRVERSLERFAERHPALRQMMG